MAHEAEALADPYALVQPAFHTGPSWDATDGPVAARIGELVGMTPDPEQQLFLDDLFAVREVDGEERPVSLETALIAPRQQLKTGALKIATLTWAFASDAKLIVWSAHEYFASQEAFRDLRTLIEEHSFLMERVAQIRTAPAREAIELFDGTRIIFRARHEGAGRSLSGDKVILDEAYALTADHTSALLPTMGARPKGQVVYASSAGLAKSSVLRDLRDRGRNPTPGQRLTYLEWASIKPCAVDRCRHVIGDDGCALNDVREWKKANPLLGRRRLNGTTMSLDYLNSMRESLGRRDPEKFAREHMGWWTEPGASEVFGPGRWEACARPETPGLKLSGVGVAVDRDLTRAAIVGAGVAPDGVIEVRPLRTGPGVSWLEAEVEALRRQHDCLVVSAEKGPEAGLAFDMRRLSRAEDQDACGALYVRVRDRQVAHADYLELTASVDASKQRWSSDRWTWTAADADGEGDTSVIKAATWAAYAAAGKLAPVKSFYVEHGLVMV